MKFQKLQQKSSGFFKWLFYGRYGRKLLLILSLAVLLPILWSLWWFISAARTQSAVDGWANELRGRGYVVNYGKITQGGFPFRIDTYIYQPSIIINFKDVLVNVSAQRLTQKRYLWRFRHTHWLGDYIESEASLFGARDQKLRFDTLRFEGYVDHKREGTKIDWRFQKNKMAAINYLPEVTFDQIRLQTDPIENASFYGAWQRFVFEAMGQTSAENTPIKLTASGSLLNRFQNKEALPMLQEWRAFGGQLQINEMTSQIGNLEIKNNEPFALSLDQNLLPAGYAKISAKGLSQFSSWLQNLNEKKILPDHVVRQSLRFLNARPDQSKDSQIKILSGYLLFDGAVIAPLWTKNPTEEKN